MANAITKVITKLRGELVGTDKYHNQYFQEKKNPSHRRRKRWIIYADGANEASLIPPTHYNWLHYTMDEFPNEDALLIYDWQRPREMNMTGTPMAWRPPGHQFKGGERPKATGDYEPWQPE